MANKRFVKPIRPDITTPAIADEESIRVNRDAIARNEYIYCMAEARRLHPEWTLKQRQEYARNAAQSLFD